MVHGQTNDENAKLAGEVGKILREYCDAYSRRDIPATIRLFADNGFAYSSSAGGYMTNTELKQTFRTSLGSSIAAATKDTFEIEDLKVISVTPDTAVANYTLRSKTEQDGKATGSVDRTTNVLVRRDGRWQIVADHTSRMPVPLAPVISGLPVGWWRTPANSSNAYLIAVDTNVKHEGQASALIKLGCGEESDFGSLGQVIAADEYRSKRIRYSGWLKTENADAVGLWLRIDGDRRTLGFDNMMDRPVRNTTGWKQYEVVLDVPAEAVNIVFGTLVNGKGQAWVDDLKLEIVASTVASTNQLSAEAMGQENTRVPKRSDNKQPVNLGFENGTVP
jgi:ketosteroid isomerase-like protein